MTPGARLAGRGGRLFSAAELNAVVVTSPRIMAFGNALAKRCQLIWQEMAPVFDPGRSRRAAPPHGQPGDYKKSIRVTFIQRRHRIAWRVGTDNERAMAVEFGSKHFPKMALREKTLQHSKGGAR